MAERIKLRGHHLLCILTYKGEGYTPEFVENFDIIVERINRGAEIFLAEGPDDVCAALHNKNGPTCEHGRHCLEPRVARRDSAALAAVAAALKRPLPIGMPVSLGKKDYGKLRAFFADGSLRDACAGCEWHGLCTHIAEEEFKDARLMPQAR